MRYSNHFGEEVFPHSVFKKKKLGRDNCFFLREYPFFNDENEHFWRGDDNFVEPSTATGKYFPEVWEKYLSENPIYQTSDGNGYIG